MVDMIFLVESTVTHKGKPKPLMWERLKFTERFAFVNMSRVSHVVVDDRLRTRRAREEEWFTERQQTDHGIAAVKEWAEGEGGFGPEDLFISGNVDEIMSQEALHQLRWCEVANDVTTGALWMPIGDLGQALRSDFPVAGRPHTLGLPAIYRWRKVTNNRLPGRMPPLISSQIYVRGGAHLTNSALLVTRIIKELTATEDVFYGGYVNTDYLLSLTEEEANSEQAKLYRLEGQSCWAANRDPVERATDIIARPPWWLACNPARFPYWYNRSEPRNRDLVAALQGARSSITFGDESYSHLPGGPLMGEMGQKGQQKVLIQTSQLA
jgi:hypothetical protein